MIQIVYSEDPVKLRLLLGNFFPLFQPLLTPLVFQPKFDSSPPPRQVSRETHVHGPTKSLQSCPILLNAMDCSLPGPLSMGFSRQEYWNGLPCSSPGDLSDPGID